ncbi:UDP-N-acetylmuramoyl-L-alanine--D-glutamate ligase [Chryseomicrobium excrementi]|uniref:UDP-N-acetylmuramoylalanine--D-glutamate ligase n=1 Tax=Chryseomicrobium excrementi TaxID=2041346 RepID=A0A2M9F3A8_9BACL|nr:UDP-N-acetylmuramoyl-L-alanine--D-glutamate ligase [Chryseomicrobium excrementi]PJK17947.1 UDP-N-acetylmuramoyl-L-alanine--D-glutamate ligase [Chryseomicrobium excrementi]
MKQLKEVYHQKVLVLGLAKSGTAAAETLHELGAFVTVNDAKPFEENEHAQHLLKQGLTVICGSHPENLLDEGFTLIVKNPGIPYSNPVLQEARKREIPIWTEIELAYRISEAQMVGITGSNGKTTTTTLLMEMLSEGPLEPLVAGNIGTVATTVAKSATKNNVIVTELSSFQLMGTVKLKPSIAIITNIYEAHLDYHTDLEEYIQAKLAISQNQTSADTLIYNGEQDVLVDRVKGTSAKLLPFYVSGRQDEGISADHEWVYWLGSPLYKRDEIRLPGQHNLENVLAATAAAMLLHAPLDQIRKTVSTFAGVKHRTQFAGEWQGRLFYNDSKATNALATKSALEGFTRPVILLAGGKEREHSFDELIPYLGNLKAVYHFGETAPRLQKFLEAHDVKGAPFKTLTQAFEEAVVLSEPGDVILLSPASASWDQYESFEIRGDEFLALYDSLN